MLYITVKYCCVKTGLIFLIGDEKLKKIISKRAPRALFYSHDTVGLGHLRRTLLLCEGLSEHIDNLSLLIVTGSAMAHAFRIPPGVDYVKLPCVTKLDNEVYKTRSLSVPFETTLDLRRELIYQTAVSYQPDFIFVDNVPLGMKGEMVKTLEYVRAKMPNTSVFLGLRDILDDSSHIVPLWRRTGVIEVLEKFYDRIFVYGLPAIFDPVKEYELPDSIRSKTRFCGYIPRRVDEGAAREARRQLCPGNEKLVMVTVGGGSDGVQLVDNYLQASVKVHKDFKVRSLVILGPEMDSGHTKRLMSLNAADSPIRIVEYCDDPLPFMKAADLVVSMGGYNTISEILALAKSAIVVPRVFPRQEQLIRTQRLDALGYLRMIHPDDLNPRRLADEMTDCLRAGRPEPVRKIEFSALEVLKREMYLLQGAIL